MKFEMELSQLLTILAPVAKAITCMESTHSNVPDVYVFWLAVTATIHQIIIEDVTGLPFSVVEDIRRAVNFRFGQMLNDAPDDVSITDFILDPRTYTDFDENSCSKPTVVIEYRGADIIRDLNPLAIERIRIPAINGTHGRPRWIKVHRICFDYPLAYLKYINCYVIAAYMSAYVKFATKYAITANVSKQLYICMPTKGKI
jgi:hypothetical protein